MNKKSKTTKKALLLSAGSLMLSCAMLVGTTFAWFSDTVTSGQNTIVAGNLDAALFYAKPTVQGDGSTTWDFNKELTKTASKEDLATEGEDIFVNLSKDGSAKGKWEPGHMEVAHLRVDNKGSLAFQYDLKIKVLDETSGTNVNDAEFKLSDYIKVTAITSNINPNLHEADGNAAPTSLLKTREDAKKWLDPKAVTEYFGGDDHGLQGDQGVTAPDKDSQKVTCTEGKLKDVKAHGTIYPGQTQNNGSDMSTRYVTLIVYMPENVGNIANYKSGDTPEDTKNAPQLNFTVELFATQTPYENDSFDDQYDKIEIVEEDSEEDRTEVTVKENEEKVISGDFSKTVVVKGEPGKTSTINLSTSTLGTPNAHIEENTLHLGTDVAIYIESGDIILKGDGVVDGENKGFTIMVKEGASLTIEDGTFRNGQIAAYAPKDGEDSKSSITITGGHFENLCFNSYDKNSQKPGIDIKGGTFGTEEGKKCYISVGDYNNGSDGRVAFNVEGYKVDTQSSHSIDGINVYYIATEE